jgi:hypothetical protein
MEKAGGKMVGLISTFRHELVSTVLVSAFIGALMWPFKRVVAAYKETTAKLEAVHNELTTQRENCLTSLQRQGDKQIELLGKAVDVLGEMHTDSKLMLEHLRDERKG